MRRPSGRHNSDRAWTPVRGQARRPPSHAAPARRRTRGRTRSTRELAAARPDAFRPDLAIPLTNMSVRLAGLGRREDALAAIEEAAQVYRELAAR